MNNNIRLLNDAELSSVAGGYYGSDVIPDPVFKQDPLPWPIGGDGPTPDPAWGWSFGGYIINPAWGVPTPEPALQGIGKP